MRDLIWMPLHGGVQGLAFFPNGYGVSVVKHKFSYGYHDDLWELAVLRGKFDKYELAYDTPITDDVLGYLTDEAVDDVMRQIQELDSVKG